MRKANEVRLIDANNALRLLTDLLDKETGAYSKGRNYGLNVARSMLKNPDACPTLTLNTLRDAIYADAVAHGLWKCEGQTNSMLLKCARRISREVSKLIVAVDNVLETRANGKDDTDAFEHYAEELADVIIMSLSVAGELGIDIDAAVRRKMKINKERPWKHGKEAKARSELITMEMEVQKK